MDRRKKLNKRQNFSFFCFIVVIYMLIIRKSDRGQQITVIESTMKITCFKLCHTIPMWFKPRKNRRLTGGIPIVQLTSLPPVFGSVESWCILYQNGWIFLKSVKTDRFESISRFSDNVDAYEPPVLATEPKSAPVKR